MSAATGYLPNSKNEGMREEMRMLLAARYTVGRGRKATVHQQVRVLRISGKPHALPANRIN